MKTDKGRIIVLGRKSIPEVKNGHPFEYPENLGYLYTCKFLDHPVFSGATGHTSLVVKEEGDRIETLNSIYHRVEQED